MKQKMLLFFGSFLIMGSAFADYRDFPYTYQARTLPQKHLEFEYYIDAALPDFDLQNIYSWRQQLEIEYGVTDKLSVALYQSWSTEPFIDGSNSIQYRTTFDEIKVMSKYRLAEPGQWFIDPLLYVEYIMSTSFVGKADEVEVKQVFSKDIDDLHLALNFSEEYQFENEWEIAYDTAVGYSVLPWIEPGLQLRGEFHEDQTASIGPSISIKGDNIYLTTGVVFELTDKANDLDARALVGIHI